MKIALVTDSTSDIPEDLAEKHRIQVVRNLVIIDGKSLEDGKDITREQFYRLLPSLSTPPTTATTSAGIYEELYERLLSEGYEKILSIHASSLLSGIVNAASLAAQQFGSRVHVADSLQVSLGLGFQVLALAEALARGAHFEELLEIFESVRKRVRVIAMLDTLEYVRRSGRVSWTRARLGNLLNVKPFVEIQDGKVNSLGEVRTRRKGIEHLLQLLHEQGPLERLAVLHSNAEADARNLLEQVRLPVATPPLVVNITMVIGTHTGPNGLGFAAVVAP